MGEAGGERQVNHKKINLSKNFFISPMQMIRFGDMFSMRKYNTIECSCQVVNDNQSLCDYDSIIMLW